MNSPKACVLMTDWLVRPNGFVLSCVFYYSTGEQELPCIPGVAGAMGEKKLNWPYALLERENDVIINVRQSKLCIAVLNR